MATESKGKQYQKFKQAARKLKTDESEENFDRVLKKVVTAVRHASDCAVNSAPAYPPGPCDCGVIKARR